MYKILQNRLSELLFHHFFIMQALALPIIHLYKQYAMQIINILYTLFQWIVYAIIINIRSMWSDKFLKLNLIPLGSTLNYISRIGKMRPVNTENGKGKSKEEKSI